LVAMSHIWRRRDMRAVKDEYADEVYQLVHRWAWIVSEIETRTLIFESEAPVARRVPSGLKHTVVM
jgi:hypothetical protein